MKLWNLKSTIKYSKAKRSAIGLEDKGKIILAGKEWINPYFYLIHEQLLMRDYNFFVNLLRIAEYTNGSNMFVGNISDVNINILNHYMFNLNEKTIRTKLDSCSDLGYISYQNIRGGSYNNLKITIHPYNKEGIIVYQQNEDWLNEYITYEKDTVLGETEQEGELIKFKNVVSIGRDTLLDTNSNNGSIGQDTRLEGQEQVAPIGQDTRLDMSTGENILELPDPGDTIVRLEPMLCKAKALHNYLDDHKVSQDINNNTKEDIKTTVCPPPNAVCSTPIGANGTPNIVNLNNLKTYEQKLFGKKDRLSQLEINKLPFTVQSIVTYYENSTGINFTNEDLTALTELLTISFPKQISIVIDIIKMWIPKKHDNFDMLTESEKKDILAYRVPGNYLKEKGMKSILAFCKRNKKYQKFSKNNAMKSGFDKEWMKRKQEQEYVEMKKKLNLK